MSDRPKPLLPTVTGAWTDHVLREQLRALRGRAPGREVGERIDAVLAGQLSLRELLRDKDFGAFLRPLAERGVDDLMAKSPAERAALAQQFEDEGRAWERDRR